MILSHTDMIAHAVVEEQVAEAPALSPSLPRSFVVYFELIYISQSSQSLPLLLNKLLHGPFAV